LDENQRIQDEGGTPLAILFEDAAKAWVRDGKQHETGFWIDDDGIVQYAEAEPAIVRGDLCPYPATFWDKEV
jgi:hypothetical protein